MAKCKICGTAVKSGNVFHSACWEHKANEVAEAFCDGYFRFPREYGNGFCNMHAAHEDIGSKAIAFCGTRGIQMGWLASQADMLAEDWELVPDGASGMPRPTGEGEKIRVRAMTLPEETRTVRDPENEDTIWVELPDNLRLKFVDGRYAGWYTPKLEEALG